MAYLKKVNNAKTDSGVGDGWCVVRHLDSILELPS